MSHWPDIFEGDGSPAFECWTQSFVYFPGRGFERQEKGKMVDRNVTHFHCTDTGFLQEKILLNLHSYYNVLK